MDADLGIRLKKEPASPLKVFKNQSLLKRKFGLEAVVLYSHIEGDKTAADLMEELEIREERLMEIIEFMNNNGMVSIDSSEEEESSPRRIRPPSRNFEISGDDEPEDDEAKGDDSDDDDSKGGKADEDSDFGKDRGRGRDSGDGDDEESEGGDEKEGGDDSEGGRKKVKARGRRGDTDSEDDEGGIGILEKELADDSGDDSDGGDSDGDDEGDGDSGDSGLLSPLEKIIFKKYGKVGVRIFNLIDGERSAEEILRETGVSEAKLVEILEFMDEKGIIKLEKPDEGKEEKEEKDENDIIDDIEDDGDSDGGREPRFSPMVEVDPDHPSKVELPARPAKEEEKKDEEDDKAKQADEVLMVDVPSMVKISIFQRAVLFAELATKFGKNAQKLMELVDGSRDFVQLSFETGLSFLEIDSIMAYFGKKGFLTFRQLDRDEIKQKYGEDGFAIYKRYGRDGLLVYEMIGKEASLKDLIVRSKLDPDHAIDVIVFIHRVLGLEIPIDRDVIYKQLGLKV